MSQLEELAQLDRAWQAILARIDDLPAVDFGAFGHRRQRRLGLRLPTHCWALLSGRSSSAYAIAVELSATGVVLEFVGRRGRLVFRSDQRYGLDLFVPGATSPVRVVARPVRSIAQRHAFELVRISAVDRLTLAEHLDHVLSGDLSPAPSPLPAMETPRTKPRPFRATAPPTMK